MEEVTTRRDRRLEAWDRLTLDLWLDLFFLATLAWVLVDFFLILLVGIEWAGLDTKVNAKVINTLQNIRFAIQNLLG
jgi:hypothetical protein